MRPIEKRVAILSPVMLVVSLSVFLRGGTFVKDKLLFVIDGDTAQFKGMRCRFAYVDTPESGNNQKAYRDSVSMGIPLSEIYQAGRYAKRYTKSRIHKGRYYDINVVKNAGRYGRAICEIFLEDGRSLNTLLVSDGFAVPFWKYIPKSKTGEYRSAILNAKSSRKGLWRIGNSVISGYAKSYQ